MDSLCVSAGAIGAVGAVADAEGVTLSPGSMAVEDPEVTAVVDRVCAALSRFYKAPAALTDPFQELAPLVDGTVAAEVREVLKMDMTEIGRASCRERV